MICAAFSIPPSRAMREPLALCLSIIELRAYARAHAAVRDAADPRDLPNDPLIHEVRSNDVLAQAEALMRWGQEID
jgi:hypothetical protein